MLFELEMTSNMKVLTPDFEKKIFEALTEALAENRTLTSAIWARKFAGRKGFWVYVFNYDSRSSLMEKEEKWFIDSVENAAEQGCSFVEDEGYYIYISRKGVIFAILPLSKNIYIRAPGKEEIDLEKVLEII